MEIRRFTRKQPGSGLVLAEGHGVVQPCLHQIRIRVPAEKHDFEMRFTPTELVVLLRRGLWGLPALKIGEMVDDRELDQLIAIRKVMEAGDRVPPEP